MGVSPGESSSSVTTMDRLRMFVFGQPLEQETSIYPVPQSDRRYGFWSLSAMFAGTQIAVSFFIVGASMIRGVPVWQAMVAVLIGYLVGFFLNGLIGAVGQREGIPTMVASRPSFGIRGAILPIIIVFIELGGWNAVHIALGALALKLLVVGSGLAPDTNAVFIGCVIFFGALTLLITTRGGLAIRKMNLVVVPLLLVTMGYLAFIALGEKSLGTVLTTSPEGPNTFIFLIDIAIISALTWAPLMADYTRMGINPRPTFAAAWLSMAVVGTFMHSIGMFSASGLGMENPILALNDGSILSIIGMFAILFSTLTTAVLILYSSSISGITIAESFGIELKFWQVALIVALPSMFLAGFINVVLFVLPFLEWLGALLTPVFGVMLADYYITRKRQLNLEELYRGAASVFWGTKGVNLNGYTAAVIGALTYVALVIWVRPVAPWILASVITIAVSGALYVALEAKRPNGRKGVAPSMDRPAVESRRPMEDEIARG